MRSTFIHLKGCNQHEVANALSDFSAKGLYLGWYEDHRTEFSWEEGEELKARLGIFPPDITVVADNIGRIVGYDESLLLAQFLLNSFEGLVQDDGEGIWNLEELLADSPSKGRYFMESSRHLFHAD